MNFASSDIFSHLTCCNTFTAGCRDYGESRREQGFGQSEVATSFRPLPQACTHFCARRAARPVSHRLVPSIAAVAGQACHHAMKVVYDKVTGTIAEDHTIYGAIQGPAKIALA
jgi:hypothetical protein